MVTSDRRAALLILRAAAVEVAVGFRETKRIVRPVVALRLDDVEMGEQQNRFVRTAATIADDEIAILRQSVRRPACRPLGKPACSKRVCNCCAAIVVLPLDAVVFVSISSRRIAWPSW